jgi:hypothetical protein
MMPDLARPTTILLALLVACAPAQPPPAAVSLHAPAAPAGADAGPRSDAPHAPEFAAAVEAGTRALDGRPGPRYWQQRVQYRFEVALDPDRARLEGRGTIHYHNQSPDTLRVLVLRLYQNLFTAGEARNRRVPVTGGVDLGRLAVDGVEARPTVGARPGTRAFYSVNGTVLTLRLPAPLAPGGTVTLEADWGFQVPPRGAPRTAHVEGTLFSIAQWYPQVAVYDDLRGWDVWPYLGQGEFYLEYADFEVAITLPGDWLVGATGELVNGSEILAPALRERLDRAAGGDAVVPVVTAADLAAGGLTRPDAAGRVTWRFRAADVRDFAFAASDAYLWDAASVAIPARADGGAGRVMVHALYRATARHWPEAADMTRHALRYHAERWHPYLYPQITAAEGPIGGMEYPMVIFVGSFHDPLELYTTLNHEVAHQWFPMMVGSNEHAYAWMDEGLATYVENLATADRFPGYPAFASEMGGYLAVAGSAVETPLMRHADLHGSYAALASAAYFKPAVLLRALGGVIGDGTVRRALAEYARRWLFRHPAPQDFFATVEDVAGRDLSWFWGPWWYTTGVADHALAGVAERGDGSYVIVEDRGGMPLPVELLVETADGVTHRLALPAETWLDGSRRVEVRVPSAAPVVRVVLDPEARYPYIDPAALTWERTAVPAGS